MAVHKGVGDYGAPITLEQAKKVMPAAEAKAMQQLLRTGVGTLSPFAAVRRFSPLSEELLACRLGDRHAS